AVEPVEQAERVYAIQTAAALRQQSWADQSVFDRRLVEYLFGFLAQLRIPGAGERGAVDHLSPALQLARSRQEVRVRRPQRVQQRWRTWCCHYSTCMDKQPCTTR